MRKVLILSMFVVFLVVSCGKTSKLNWSKKTPEEMTWSDAKAYCENLNEDGYSDWRLPTISELRTLIKNCSVTETGGECKASDNCLSSSCQSIACMAGCSMKEDAQYSKLSDKGYFWSLSEQSDSTSNAWTVGFYQGGVYNSSKNDKSYVRCLR